MVSIISTIIIMQVTIYLTDDLIERVEELAQKTKKSRSAVVQEILAEGLSRRSKGTPASELVSLFGSWKMTPTELKQIRRVRGKDARKAEFS